MKKIIALFSALTVFIVSVGCGKSYEDMVEEAARLTPEEQSIRDETEKTLKEYREWKERQDNAISKVDSDFDYYQSLWDELKDIADENGCIEPEKLDRAKHIVDELNDALDLDITISDSYITDYDSLYESMK